MSAAPEDGSNGHEAVEASPMMVSVFSERFLAFRPSETRSRLQSSAGLTWVASALDEGENHYYFVEKT